MADDGNLRRRVPSHVGWTKRTFCSLIASVCFSSRGRERRHHLQPTPLGAMDMAAKKTVKRSPKAKTTTKAKKTTARRSTKARSK
jgi:hypothetical protein